MVAIPLRLDARSYPRDTVQAPHRDGALQISLVVRGALAETVSGATEFAGALSIVVKDPDVVHADRFGPAGADILRLSTRRHSLGDLLDDPRRSPRAPHGSPRTHDGRAALARAYHGIHARRVASGTLGRGRCAKGRRSPGVSGQMR